MERGHDVWQPLLALVEGGLSQNADRSPSTEDEPWLRLLREAGVARSVWFRLDDGKLVARSFQGLGESQLYEPQRAGCWALVASCLAQHRSQFPGRIGEPSAFHEQAALFVSSGSVLYVELDHAADDSLCARLSSFAAVLGSALRLAENDSRLVRASHDEAERAKGRATTLPLPSFDEIVYASSKLDSLLKLAQRLVDSDLPVLICGESGTGKSLLGRAMHAAGSRRAKPLISVDVRQLIDEWARETFLGVAGGKPGLFQRADGGTLFLYEVSLLPLGLQDELLRLIQEGEVQSIGSNQATEVDVRVIGSTQRNLQLEIQAGRFREELFYRLGGVTITIPPLRDRADDIPVLLDHFLTQHAGRRPLRLHPSVAQALGSYTWPGNVREVRRVVRYLSVFADEDGEIREMPRFGQSGEERYDESRYFRVPIGVALDEAVMTAIRKTLEHTGGNKSKAAKLLQIDRVTFYRKLKAIEEANGESI
ncbi:MAG: sigma 54-interacting transcriptional regulator [Myxococcales bacterium]|nr:sigma 54-interacting transcriptional regulator [Myxococcales bacterium]